MPPRWLCWIIVGSWLATMGWLFWHDLLPRWLPGEPPPFHIDDVEEVQKSANPMHTNWTVERQERDQSKPRLVFNASTCVENHKEEDEYTLNASLKTEAPNLKPVIVAKFFQIKLLTSAYRVNRSGQLRSLETTVRLKVTTKEHPLFKFLRDRLGLEHNAPPVEQIELRIRGEIRDRQFFAHCRVGLEQTEEGKVLDNPSYKPIHFDLPPVPVSYTGSVLMPLHPVSHIRGLRLGQSWRQPLIDPLRDALAFLPDFSGGVRWLNAHVLPQPEILDLDGNRTSCLVIEYTNDENEPMGRTWVEQDGERVLQQEAILEESRWIMKRELIRGIRNRLLDLRHD
jgi:hypothetical protein